MDDFDRYLYEKCRNDPSWACEEIAWLRGQLTALGRPTEKQARAEPTGPDDHEFFRKQRELSQRQGNYGASNLSQPYNMALYRTQTSTPSTPEKDQKK